MNKHATCPSHPNRHINMVCLDGDCPRKSHFCFICSKTLHGNCDENMIVSVHELQNNIEVKKPRLGLDNIKKELDTIIENEITTLNEDLQRQKEEILNFFKSIDDPNDLLSPTLLKQVKDQFKIKYDKELNKTIFHSNYDFNERTFERSLNYFKHTLKGKTEAFKKDFSQLRFIINGDFTADTWLCHEEIVIKNVDEGVLLQRTKEKVELDDLLTVYELPLIDSVHKFKITIKGVDESDRYFPFGIMNETIFSEVKKDFVFSNDYDVDAFYGYGTIGEFKGKELTTNKYDSNGFKEGFQFYIEYTPGKELRFYNKDDSLCLTKKIESDKEVHYLFINLVNTDVACVINKLDE